MSSVRSEAEITRDRNWNQGMEGTMNPPDLSAQTDLSQKTTDPRGPPLLSAITPNAQDNIKGLINSNSTLEATTQAMGPRELGDATNMACISMELTGLQGGKQNKPTRE